MPEETVLIAAGTYEISWFLSAIGERQQYWSNHKAFLLEHWRNYFAFDIIETEKKIQITLEEDLSAYTPISFTSPIESYLWIDSKTMTVVTDSSFATDLSNLEDDATTALYKNDYIDAQKELQIVKERYYSRHGSYPIYVKKLSYAQKTE